MPQRRLHSLDTLRGIAALAVVLWHWQHFFDLSRVPIPGWKPALEPLFCLLKPAYISGWIAVDLFFALSGFVFFWLYSQAIAERAITAGRFALLRFSRLYPLHWLTLVFVALLQWTYWRKTGGFFVYQPNDLSHFLPAIALAQNWVDELQAFNGPSWSVSVEVLLYIVFFALCRLRLLHWTVCLAMAAVGFAIVHFHILDSVGRGFVAFFIGAMTFKLADRMRQSKNAVLLARLVAAFALAAWGVTILSYYWSAPDHVIGWVMDLLGPQSRMLSFDLVLAAPALIALSLHEWVLEKNYKRFSLLGDISYSIYMLHFPMQITLANIAVRRGWDYSGFETPYALAGFFAVLIGLGLLSYHRFERPLQAAIRGRGGRHSAPPI